MRRARRLFILSIYLFIACIDILLACAELCSFYGPHIFLGLRMKVKIIQL